jgi:putative peptidoglycan lipid II flippase
MSREVASKDMGKLKDTVNFSLKTVFTVMIPASIGLMVLAHPIVRILFQRGEFTEYSTMITTSALFFYTFGLFAYAGIKILVSAYYSMGDTRTPVKTASVSLLVNLVLNLILMWPLKVGGLALATSIAAMFNFITLYVILVKRVGDIDTSRILDTFARVFAASLVMGAFAFAVSRIFLHPTEISGVRGFVGIMVMIVASGAVYLLAALAVKVEGARWLVLNLRNYLQK